MRLTRRAFLRAAIPGAAISALTTGYAVGLEPFRLHVQRYSLSIDGWAGGILSIAALSDIHACRPWMTPDRIATIVDATHALAPDLIVLLGDYIAGHHFVTGSVNPAHWSSALSKLRAPLGVYAVVGNHDWWGDSEAQRNKRGPTFSHRALTAAGISVLENVAIRLVNGNQPFWLAGLGDQLAFFAGQPLKDRISLLVGRGWNGARVRGVDDLPGTIAQVTDDAPIVLLAHEPDIFASVPGRVSVTLSGHTHGGQIRLFGYSPFVPSRFGNSYAYGHVSERTPTGEIKHLIVSGGLGCTFLPMRFGVPPEITVVTLGRHSI